MIVSKDGNGDFDNLQDAINAVPENNSREVIINIKNGIYKEKVNVTKPFITLIGEDPEYTILTFDDAAKKPLSNGEPMRTFNSYTIFVDGDDFTAENMTFENSAGSGEIVGQAVAAYVNGNRNKFKNCKFLACQDTLFTGPLPPKPIEGNNFGGPMEGKPRRNVKQYYESCFIRGDIDFIFGSATAVFNKCEIFSNDRKETVNGFVTAASTPEGNAFGYVFIDCKLTSNAAPNTVYLGRPWRDYAKTAFIHCYLGEHIKVEGWDSWNKLNAEKFISYVEYDNYGPGADKSKRADFSKLLTSEEAKDFSISNILGKNDNWTPHIN
ncbi:pectinesterase family protein [Clostridium hydrogenum]|uniref:pectinesterase family protein n=1 Tax=Clostridium hydrogenum TaxID=2855764 RepID=UPI001F1A2D52|nr:pectinesterase family protein [Clostridium hydrogenum]